MIINNLIINKANDFQINDILAIELEQIHPSLNVNIINEDFKNPNCIYFVAKQDNIIVGYVSITLSYDHIDLTNIAIKNTYKKLGIATRLIEYIINIALEKNFESIFLEVRKSNGAAINLYEKLKFDKIGIRKNYYTRPMEDAQIYKLNLIKNTI